MTVVRVSPSAPEPAIITRATVLLRAGQVVAFPTETVYGLGANALDPEAVERIYRIKGRPAYNPLIVHVADLNAAQQLTSAWPAAATELASRYWPGPLTLVLPKSHVVPQAVSAGLATVALRVPMHPVAQALLRAAALPLAAPSANRSGEVSPTTAAHVAKSLGEEVPLILDGGPTAVGIESAVIDLSGPVPVLLRPGMITREELTAVLGTVTTPAGAAAGGPVPSPGMQDRHYAPRARLLLFDPRDPGAALAECRALGGRSAAVVRSAAPDGVWQVITLPADPPGYGRELYNALHQLDDAGVDLILVERLPDEPAWDAIRDRLERASRG